MELTNTTAEPSPTSISSALERLGTASQAVVAKRIDLAMLESGEAASRFAGHAAMVLAAGLLLTAAWWAAVLAITMALMPAQTARQLIVFALANVLAGSGLMLYASRPSRPAQADPPDDRNACADSPHQ